MSDDIFRCKVSYYKILNGEYFMMNKKELINETKPLIETTVTANREHKDKVFRLLFNNKKNLMDLYNALNKSNYTNEKDFTINTLDNAIFMSMKNDISFIVGSDMCLYEHQSTVCPNMPLRGLFYISELYKRIKEEKRLYSSTLIDIPTPYYIVFYNGIKNMEDITIQRLSDAFLNKNKKGCIEITATLININFGHNQELMESCHILRDYAFFISRIREHLNKFKGFSDKNKKYEAISIAIDECIKQNILSDFLKKHRAEVVNMSIFEYDEEEAKEVFREDGRIEGMLQAKTMDILELLEDIGEISQPLKNKICSQTDVDILKKWLKAAAKSSSLEEFESLMVK